MNKINRMIKDEIIERVRSSITETKYRTQLVGFADVNDPFFKELKTNICEEHYLSSDLLENAKNRGNFLYSLPRRGRT